MSFRAKREISQSALAEFLREIPRPDAKLATQTYVFVKQLQWLVNEIAKLESMKLEFALRINCKEVDEFALTELERLLEILDPD